MKGVLVDQLDDMAKAKGCANRSQASASAVRDCLVEHYGQKGTQDITATAGLTRAFGFSRRDNNN